jgi:hypothetical protein
MHSDILILNWERNQRNLKQVRWESAIVLIVEHQATTRMITNFEVISYKEHNLLAENIHEKQRVFHKKLLRNMFDVQPWHMPEVDRAAYIERSC